MSSNINMLDIGTTAATGGLLDPALNRRTTFHTFIADEDIAVGDCVALSFADVSTAIDGAVAVERSEKDDTAAALLRVRITDTVPTGALGFIGVAAKSASEGDQILVATGGYVNAVASGGSVAAGDILAVATARSVVKYNTTTHADTGPIGFALSTDAAVAGVGDAAAYCAMWLYPRV